MSTWTPIYILVCSPITTQQRVCIGCHEAVTAAVPTGLAASRTNSLERIFIDQRRLNIPSPTRAQSSSQLSDLAEYVQLLVLVLRVRELTFHRCPVCNLNLNDVGPPNVQEAHVKNCLEGGTGAVPQTAKYLVYKLPEESALIGIECENPPSHTRLSALTVLCRCDLFGGIRQRLDGGAVELSVQLPQRYVD